MTTTATPSDRMVYLGAARVDLDAERVFGPDGRAATLRPQTFAVLRHLIANAGRLVTKDELQNAVWPGIVVTDDSLVQCIGEIRKALGDDARKLVETVPRRGYRLVPAPRAARPAAWREGRAAAFGATLVLVALGIGAWQTMGAEEAPSHTPVVAVLPFDSMAGEEEAYLGPGVAEDVISMLARSPDVAVIARGSSFAYGDKPRDVREIGEALGADYVLEGSVRREGDTLRIVAQLEDTETGQHVWADRFDRVGTDPWALVDEVSGRIIFALAGEKGEIKRAQFRKAWGKDATSLGEYDYFLRGLDVYMNARDPDELARAGAIWEEGLEHYPDSALLKTKLAWRHWTAAWRYWDDLAHNFAEADRLVSEALAQDHLSPEVQRSAHWLNAFVLMQRGDYDEGVAEAERTIAITPYDARVLRQPDRRADRGRGIRHGARLACPRRAARTRAGGRIRAAAGADLPADGPVRRGGRGIRQGGGPGRLSAAVARDRAGQLGRIDEARDVVRGALANTPDFTQAMWREGSFYSDPGILDGEIAALAEAGLPGS